jgi:hypothetical protein
MKIEEVAVGDVVQIVGVVVGTKVRKDGSEAVQVEYSKRGVPHCGWFDATDLDDPRYGEVADGAGV